MGSTLHVHSVDLPMNRFSIAHNIAFVLFQIILELGKQEAEVDNGTKTEMTPAQERYQCTICTNTYATKQGAQRHLKSHQPGLYRCFDCHTYYKTKEEYESHKASRHPGPIPCDSCGATFTRKSALNYHYLKYHDKNYQAKFQCTFEGCNRLFHLEKAFVEHTNRHMGITPYQCEKCGKMFSLSDTMTRHKRICVENQKYACDVCDKQYASRGALSSHKNAEHLNKLHACTCGSIFKHLSGLLRHRKTTGHRRSEQTLEGPAYVESYTEGNDNMFSTIVS